jgi:hypothetical protein
LTEKNKKMHYMWSCVNIIHMYDYLCTVQQASKQGAHGG